MGIFFNKKPKEYSIDDEMVCKDFVKQAQHFFDGYLSLCKKHDVKGLVHITKTDADAGRTNTKMECVIISIDGEYAEEAFSFFINYKKACSEEIVTKGYEVYKEQESKLIEMLEEYYGSEKLHWAYTEVDEYKVEDRVVKMSAPNTLFTFNKVFKWEPTIDVLKQEILKAWPDVTVKMSSNGIMIETK